MKKAIIIHGWESAPDEHWYQEERVILLGLGYEVCVPTMPGRSFPVEKEWIEEIGKLCPDSSSILIGHSLGAPAILRYLEKADQAVGKVFLVAGFASSLHLDYPNAEYPDAFVNHPFDWEKIRTMAKEFVVINQEHDDWVPFEKGKEMAAYLVGSLISVVGTDHFDTMDLSLINDKL